MIMYDILFPSPNMISVGIKELLMNDDKNDKDVFNFNMGVLDIAKIQQKICMHTLFNLHSL